MKSIKNKIRPRLLLNTGTEVREESFELIWLRVELGVRKNLTFRIIKDGLNE